MRLETKLKDYFKSNGLQMKWFAEQLGIPKQQLYQVIGGHAPLPKKYWKKVVVLTHGKITLYDILLEHLSNIEEVEIKSNGFPDRCEISLKDFNAIT